MTRFAAVIFDNDGLLLDTEEMWARGARKLFARHGQTYTERHQSSLLGLPPEMEARKLEGYLDLPHGAGDTLVDELIELTYEEVLLGVNPRPGAVELLRALGEAGVPCGLASNALPRFVARTLEQAGLYDAFDAIVCAADVASPKPAPDVYLETARRLGQAPVSCAALEDSPIGVAAAAAAGMFVIGVPWFPEQPMPGASLIAASLADAEVAVALGLAY